MAKTMLAVSILVGAGACQSAPTSHPRGLVGPPSTDLIESPTTSITSSTTEREPTTTTGTAPEPVEEAPVTTRTTRARSAPTTVATVYVEPAPRTTTVNWALLACIRSFEQNDNPRAGPTGYASDTGNSFYGAYQFTWSTWVSVGGSGNPAHAEPDEQDARAWRLYLRDGLAPWPTPAVKCRHLVA